MTSPEDNWPVLTWGGGSLKPTSEEVSPDSDGKPRGDGVHVVRWGSGIKVEVVASGTNGSGLQVDASASSPEGGPASQVSAKYPDMEYPPPPDQAWRYSSAIIAAAEFALRMTSPAA
ncbi:MAG TPA: hypothetical protein VGS08_01635 [Candidatus Saccharimonadales bacterium]|nr:hypothetical protein [Candidatus Saccharimonadales bacterium]